MTKICLCMIVKNESKIIDRCIKSALPILDAICISDTGSTDNTVELIEKYNETVPTKCHKEETFVNFGHNRTKSYIVARLYCQSLGWDLSTSYCLLIDADMQLKVEKFDKEKLEKLPDCVLLYQKTRNLNYRNIRMVNMNFNWKSIGVTHEYWDAPDQKFVRGNIDDDQLWIHDVGDGGSKADKFQRDVRLLEKGIEEETNVGLKTRYTFYLAQTYKDTGELEKAIEAYKKRIFMIGYWEERWYSHFMIGNLYYRLAKFDMASVWYNLAYLQNKERIEPLIAYSKMLREKGEYYASFVILEQASKIEYPKNQSLFIQKNDYGYELDFEKSVTYFYIGKYKDGLVACNRCLEYIEFPNDRKQLVRNNIDFYKKKIVNS